MLGFLLDLVDRSASKNTHSWVFFEGGFSLLNGGRFFSGHFAAGSERKGV
jgi:hypothetical protein